MTLYEDKEKKRRLMFATDISYEDSKQVSTHTTYEPIRDQSIDTRKDQFSKRMSFIGVTYRAQMIQRQMYHQSQLQPC